MGARGAVDAVLVTALTNARLDPLKATACMTRRLHSIKLDLNGQALVLFWRMGTIQGELELAPGVKWSFGEFSFPRKDDGAKGWREWDRAIDQYGCSPPLPAQATVNCTKIGHQSTILSIEPEVRHFRIVDDKAEWV